ncbi:unnamed protein product, partial [Prorocentrum cordatum]
ERGGGAMVRRAVARRSAAPGDLLGCLTAKAALQLGFQQVTVAWSPSPAHEDATWPLEVTFDGGSRRFDGEEASGAGAILWRHRLAGGAPTRVAEVVVALPAGPGSQPAEAVGCRHGLGLLRGLALPFRRARVAGDNTAAIRYGAGTGRFRRLELQAEIEEGLAPLAAEGWVLEFQAVRRRLNSGADALATEGVEWAAELRAQGDLRVQSRTRWL